MPLVLTYRHKVGKHLARMAKIGKAVNYRNRAVLRECLNLGLLKGSYHNAVDIARENSCGILYRLAASYLEVAV